MRTTIITILYFLTTSLCIYAQKVNLTGRVSDAGTGEEVIQAIVVAISDTTVISGTATDNGGYYSFSLSPGTYRIRVTHISFENSERTITLEKNSRLDLPLTSKEYMEEEVVVTADMAKPRETPVAYFNVSQKKLAEELGSRDLPMVLNTTPGVYATQQGGGAGDARVSIRGFNQRNIAVMIDGIPVNDMENGQVYWSNWFGLAEVTRTMQVQRGLGVSKIANPAVGGTINIITRGIENRPSYSAAIETGNNGYFKGTLAGTTGRLKGNSGLTYALTYRRSDGYVDAMYDNMFAYFLKLDKRIGKKHLLSLAVMGAPQSHGQRVYRVPLSVYSSSYARELGVDTNLAIPGTDKGRRFNQHWGYLDRSTINDPDGIRANGDEDTVFNGGRRQNERTNYFHKPQLYLKHLWEMSPKTFLSTVAYASSGKGGGTASAGVPQDQSTGQFKFQEVWYSNTYGNSFLSPIDPLYSTTEKKSTGIIYSNVNNHNWYGMLSTLNHQMSKKLLLSAGVDLRYYRGIHYRQVYDLLGGDYYINQVDKNQASPVKHKGDIIEYHNDGRISWGGIFGEAEYKAARYSTFISFTTTLSAYQRIDYFLPKDSITGKYNSSAVKRFPGYTAKTGFNYNLTDKVNAYANTGILSRPPRFNNVFDRLNQPVADVKNELVTSFELGAGYRSKHFSVNLNAYYTNWLNKPADFLPVYKDPDGNSYSYNINGLRAVHQGIECDFIYKLLPNLDIEGAISFADWRWKSGDTVRITDDAGNLLPGGQFYFSAKNVHVGDAAQNQVSLQLRYEPNKHCYIKPGITWFGKNYADFDPSALKGQYADRDSWKLPDYSLVNIHAGYSFKAGKGQYILNASVFNVLNTFYITDAQHRVADSSNPAPAFNPKNVEVFVGPGTTWTAGMKVIF